MENDEYGPIITRDIAVYKVRVKAALETVAIEHRPALLCSVYGLCALKVLYEDDPVATAALQLLERTQRTIGEARGKAERRKRDEALDGLVAAHDATQDELRAKHVSPEALAAIKPVIAAVTTPPWWKLP